MTNYRFQLATLAENQELCRFSRETDMPGAVRFSFDRSPNYFEALRVEGRESQVLLCRETQTGRVVGTGHRSVKPAFINGHLASLGYLSGLRIDGSVRNGSILAHGYQFLRDCHADGRAQIYLTTIMEDNRQAKVLLPSGRCGLPGYHDFGRFCCLAMSLNGPKFRAQPGISIRCATSSDGPAVVSFLQREGRLRQFFPEYRLDDFGGGLLTALHWNDVFLAYRGNELVGIAAAWDQRSFRRWQVTGYSPWLGCLQTPINVLAGILRKPLLPKPGSPLAYFILSLLCIHDHDPAVFAALLNEIIRQRRDQYSFFLAGLHERDPLARVLLTQPHFPLYSRLYVVAWEDGTEAVQQLDRRLVTYLELGAL